MKKVAIPILIISSILLMSGCIYSHNYDEKGNEMNEEQVNEAIDDIKDSVESVLEDSIISQMREYKTEYIGDNSSVSKLLSYLPQFDENYKQNMFSLQTTGEPYGITIYYEPVENVTDLNMSTTEGMTTCAGYLFNCIDNLGYVEYAYRTNPSNDVLEQSEYTVLLKVERP
ncbi:MAG: DUF4825 domain-containing protein [Lachnospiraceae bacterium]